MYLHYSHQLIYSQKKKKALEKNIYDGIKKSVNDNLINGDEYTRTKFATEATLNIGSFFIGVGEIKALSGVSKTGEVLNAMDKTADALNAMDKTSDALNAVDKTADLTNAFTKGGSKADFGACFVAGTKIITEQGNKSIEEIKIGDKVLSQNIYTGEKAYKEVKNLYVKEVDTLVHLDIEGTKINTTINHPFWLVDKGWTGAGDLKVGDKVLLASGNIAIVSNTFKEKLSEPVKVYNFEVVDWHTYFVSDVGVLVHNMCSMPNIKRGAGANSKLDEVSNIANNYKLSNSQYQNHIVTNHGYNSTIPGKSKFNSSFDIRSGIDEALKSSDSIIKPNTNGRGGSIFELKYNNTIGINNRGKDINTLKVVIDESGNVTTAFPKK